MAAQAATVWLASPQGWFLDASGNLWLADALKLPRGSGAATVAHRIEAEKRKIGVDKGGA
jgi:hypothetical protein